MKPYKSSHRQWFVLAMFILTPSFSYAQPTVYLDQASYLMALEQAGYDVVVESFENDAAWGEVRTESQAPFMVAPFVTSNGVTWMSNFEGGTLTTGPGPSYHANWGFFTYPHGNYASGIENCGEPGVCSDGFTGVISIDTIAVGGYIRSNTLPANISLILNDNVNNPVDFGETCDSFGQNCTDNAIISNSDWKFFGVIDPDGISRFQFQETVGTFVNYKFIFADYFLFGRIGGGDADLDGIPDANDNCIFVANTSQLDTDNDGYGNFCDGDFNQDLMVNYGDLSIFRDEFLFKTGAVSDMDGNGLTNFFDLTLLISAFFMPPGPSALAGN